MIYRLIFLLCLIFPSLATAENVFLFRYLEAEIGEIPPYSNLALDCTSHAGAMAVDVLAATQIHMHGRQETFAGRASPEMIHWGARAVDGQKAPGLTVIAVARYLRDYGVVYRQVYTNGKNSIDLTKYSSQRAFARANKGVPDWLKPELRTHMVRDIRHMRNAQDVVNEIKAGRPIIMGSNYAFSRKRDKDGFTVPYLTQTISGPLGLLSFSSREKWRHAMVATGYIDGERPGIVIQNSHGSKQYGPNPYDIPEGAFAVDLKYIDLMVKSGYGCCSIGDFVHLETIDVELPEIPAAQLSKFSGIVILSTPECQYCEKQFKAIEGKPYLVASVTTSKEMMKRLGFKIYPTTIVVENDQPIKAFSGFTPWEEIKPYAQNIAQDQFEYRTYGSFDDMITAAGMAIESFIDWVIENWNLFLKLIIDNFGLLAIALDSE